MKKSMKLLATVASVMMIAGSVVPVASCAKGGNLTTGNVDVVAYDGSKVTVTFYHTMGANLRGVLDKYIPKFNELYPHITIKHDQIGGYPDLRDNISTGLTVAEAPSMAYCYPDHVALYNAAKATLPLDDFIASDLEVTRADGSKETMGFTQAQLDDFVEGYYEEGKAFGDGLMYTLPFSKSTEVLYYNKTFFEAEGLKVPTTWDEMLEVCAYIENKYPDDTPLGYDSEANWFITMCEQLGSDYTSADEKKHFTFNNETNWNFVVDLKENYYNKGYVTTEEIYGSYTSELFTEVSVDDPTTEKNERKSRTYMTIGSSAGASYQCPAQIEGTGGEYPFEVGVAMIPQKDVNNPKVISQGPSICLFKKSDSQEVAAAWLFAKYLTTTVEFQAQFSMISGYAPVIKSVNNNDIYKNFLDKADGNARLQASCVKQCIAQENALFVSPAFNGSSEARDQVGLLIKDVFINNPKAGQSTLDYVKGYFSKAISNLKTFYGD